jgi:hypothetical protein
MGAERNRLVNMERLKENANPGHFRNNGRTEERRGRTEGEEGRNVKG